MTKLMQQLNFSSSNNYYDHYEAATIEPLKDNNVKENNYCGDGASLSTAGSKRSALSASDAECFSLCLGAGPLWWSDVPVLGAAPPGGVNSGASSPATPATPTHDDNTRDLLSALLWASASSLSGSAESIAEPPTLHPALQAQRREQVIRQILERKDIRPVKVEFKIFLTETTMTRWEAVVQGNTIYLRVPGVLQAGSKESFLLLLDFAEERLGSTNCIICVLKSRPDRATLMRTFMFMGFALLPPASPILPPHLAHPDYLFLHYNMQ
ncbi:LOW QUALITY PROTEIN: ornithine decarboxylase antizyme [Hyposmocoma kahamanoa]|uniref:LOW QUALITY PROTEIN: ornithine decarboxylase antizyme n=1 Tax=Hyposmocoma kahamanoa TaxID=1477025 RepID=UPI000E6D5DF2|nr:LOW QUALITY PROTEIN: ornithine decarboxylase antizyme [Hyposmocoma kahamanoa]